MIGTLRRGEHGRRSKDMEQPDRSASCFFSSCFSENYCTAYEQSRICTGLLTEAGMIGSCICWLVTYWSFWFVYTMYFTCLLPWGHISDEGGVLIGMSELILNHGSRCRWLVSFTPRRFILGRKVASTHWTGRMGPTFVWILENRKSLPFARKQTIRQLSSP